MTTPETPAAPAVPAASKPTRIPPIITADAKFFWDGADQEQFLGQKCGDCGKFRFPPRPMCPHCFSLKREEVPLSGKGTVHSWAIARHPHPFGFKEAPIIAVIELEEGTRIVSNVVGCGYDEVVQDMPVEVTFEATMNNHKVPVFKPVNK